MWRREPSHEDSFTSDVREQLRKQRNELERELSTWHVQFATKGLAFSGSPELVFWNLPNARLDREIDSAIRQALLDCKARHSKTRPILAKLRPLLVEHVEQLWKSVAERANVMRNATARVGEKTFKRPTGEITRWTTIIDQRLHVAEDGRVRGEYVYTHPGLAKRVGQWFASGAGKITVGVAVGVLTTLLATWLQRVLGR